ncbi:protein of unknown function [Shewanella benthica]|uniref:Uncharacterized protein n=1 Tax=Shewanella benthica TaxID=43661 RepID=A0A330LYM0_9GAMM|nr:protein of unknown function [Shewanella benthica]
MANYHKTGQTSWHLSDNVTVKGEQVLYFAYPLEHVWQT